MLLQGNGEGAAPPRAGSFGSRWVKLGCQPAWFWGDLEPWEGAGLFSHSWGASVIRLSSMGAQGMASEGIQEDTAGPD